jgi:Flp pilus assembly protein TadD
MRHDWFWGLALIAAVFATYLPLWWAGFIWDDDLVVTANPVVVGNKSFWDIWTTHDADICPLTVTMFRLEYAVWSTNPLPYHLVNVLLQGCNGVLLWRVLRRLRVPGAWLGAALWALHPVQVETVAWITELKNTLSGFFFLLSILFFLRSIASESVNRRREWDTHYALSLLFAAGAEASKSSTVILPLVLMLAAWWAEGRWNLSRQLKAIPVFFISIAAGLVSMATQGQQLAQHASAQFARSWSERIITAGDAVWFYLGKLIWPYPLLTVYPRWHPDAANVLSYLPTLAVVAVFVGLVLLRRQWAKPCLFAFAYFLIALAPVLGFIDIFFFHFSFVADHFQYLASMGPLALAAAGLTNAADSLTLPRWLPPTLAAVLLAVLGIISSQWAELYLTDETLWTYVLSHNPDSWLGHNRVGVAQMRRGDVDTARVSFETALKLYPDYDDALNNLAVVYSNQNRGDDAIQCLRRAVAINPVDADAHYNLGDLLMRENKLDEAIDEFKTTVRINADHAVAHMNLGVAYAKQGHDADAYNEFRKALAIVPNDALIHFNLGNFLAQRGHFAEAITEYQATLKAMPDFQPARQNLAQVQAALASPPSDRK